MNQELDTLSRNARAALSQGNWTALESLTGQLLTLYPNNAETQFLNGKFLAAQRKVRLATDAFRAALKEDKTRYDAAFELANLLVIAKQNNEAFAIAEEYKSYLTNSPRYSSLAAHIYEDIGLPDEAHNFHQQCVKLQPDVEIFNAGLAVSCTYLGKIEEAKKLYEGLLEKNPDHQRNHYFYSRLEKAVNDEHIKVMKESLERTGLPSEKNIYMYYALAKELEDLERWNESFWYLNMAGEAATKVSNYQVKEDIDIIDELINKCNQEWMQQGLNISPLSVNVEPIFIVGLPRTGSTLLEKILSSHSKIQSLGETQFLPMLIRECSGVADKRQLSTEIIAMASKSDLSNLRKRYLESLGYRLDKNLPFFIEKLPYNFLYVGFIKKAFPNAKIIYVDRNPIDACFSMYKQVFTWAYKFSYDLENLAEYYKSHLRLLSHWRELLRDQFIEIKYEDLVADPEQTIQGLMQLLNIPFEADCLDFHKNKSSSMTASSVQVRSEIYQGSVGKWKHYEPQLQPLINSLKNGGIVCE